MSIEEKILAAVNSQRNIIERFGHNQELRLKQIQEMQYVILGAIAAVIIYIPIVIVILR